MNISTLLRDAKAWLAVHKVGVENYEWLINNSTNVKHYGTIFFLDSWKVSKKMYFLIVNTNQINMNEYRIMYVENITLIFEISMKYDKGNIVELIEIVKEMKDFLHEIQKIVLMMNHGGLNLSIKKIVDDDGSGYFDLVRKRSYLLSSSNSTGAKIEMSKDMVFDISVEEGNHFLFEKFSKLYKKFSHTGKINPPKYLPSGEKSKESYGVNDISFDLKTIIIDLYPSVAK